MVRKHTSGNSGTDQGEHTRARTWAGEDMDEAQELDIVIQRLADRIAIGIAETVLPMVLNELQAIRAVGEAINAKLDTMLEDEERSSVPEFDMGGKRIV